MIDPAAQIPQGVNPAPIPDSSCADAKTLRCPAMPADNVSKVLDDDNLLIEIILRIGFPTTLVCVALICKRWLRHESDPTFLRHFRKLHPPRLLGFYLDVRSKSLGYNPTRPCFVPVLPQPPELAAVARRVAIYNFEAYDSVRIEDCQNGNILKRDCGIGMPTSRAGASFWPRRIHYNEVLCPLGPKGAVAVIPWPPHDPPRDSKISLGRLV